LKQTTELVSLESTEDIDIDFSDPYLISLLDLPNFLNNVKDVRDIGVELFTALNDAK
jgi:hypothetical protein